MAHAELLSRHAGILGVPPDDLAAMAAGIPEDRKNKKGVRFYQERGRDRDLLFVHPGQRDHRGNPEGCSTAIAGLATSVAWGCVSTEYLRDSCRRITFAQALAHNAAEDGRWTVLILRALWMHAEIRDRGEAILPY